MHIPYQQRRGHPPDFRVSYRFYGAEEGGRMHLPCQGYRSDFWYANELETDPKNIYMLWPEFEDRSGEVILDTDMRVDPIGTARMWILNPKMRKMHRGQIKIGTKGYFMEGPRRVAECEVVEILGINNNPDELTY